ncbi:MAG TPA: 1-acyl-sn-glycerol-3-phosphate acyltransferase [Saprospiraceae bacterium]|nr:1-acyl-sn-glycerol-3-phosphate acyltransferase [Saprospiraceae bacterium]
MRKFILRVCYVFLKSIVRFMFGVYYPKTQTDNIHYLNTKGPAILLSNHPNGMIDPLDTALRSNRLVHFLAKAELFSNPFLRWFFNTFYCIPIERPDFSNGKVVDNKDNFDRCNQFLQEGGALFIAPEGTSLLVRRILDLKTGAARIALQAEATMDFNMGIKIIPAGITYVNQGEFRSGHYICASEAITITQFKELYNTDPRKAVFELTALMKARLADLVIILENDDDIPLFEKLMRLLNKDIKSKPKEFFLKGKELAQRLNVFNTNQAVKISQIEKELNEIESISGKAGFKTDELENVLTRWSRKEWTVHIVLFLLGLPFFLYGLVNHIIPNIIPWGIEKLARLHVIYRSTIKMLCGLVSYLVFYSLQILVVWYLSMDLYILLIYVISLVLSGLCFYPYLKWAKSLICHWKAVFIPLSVNKELKNKILTLKNLIYN